MIFESRSESDTEALGERLSRSLPKEGAVVAMYGELGAGKTAFVRGMARGLGVSGHVVSPTFTIVNEYPGERELFHFDMYRLGGEEELFDIGWGENVPGAFDGSEIRVTIEKTGDDKRIIRIEGAGLC